MSDEVDVEHDEQVYGVLIGYSPEKNATYAILYGEYASEVLVERDDDLNWHAIVHKLADGTEHMIEPPYAVDPMTIAKAIADGNDELSENLYAFLDQDEAT